MSDVEKEAHNILQGRYEALEIQNARLWRLVRLAREIRDRWPCLFCHRGTSRPHETNCEFANALAALENQT